MNRPELEFLEGVEHPESELDAFKWYNRRSSWFTFDGGFQSYCDRADLPQSVVTPGGITVEVPDLRGLIEGQIGHDEDNVGLDLAGGPNGRALRHLLKDGVLGRALLTNYRDRRRLFTKLDDRLDHVAGDLIEPETWEEILHWQEEHAPEGLDLIMHRPGSPLQDLDPEFYRGAANLLLDRLRPGGLLFTQIPTSLLLHNSHMLREICEEIHERPDVDGIISNWSPYGMFTLLGGAVVTKTGEAGNESVMIG